MSAFSMDAPRTLSSNLNMPKPVVGTIATWIEQGEEPFDKQKQRWMKEHLASSH